MSESEEKRDEKADIDQHNDACIADSKTEFEDEKKDDDKEISETTKNENSEDKIIICDTEEKMDKESAVANDGIIETSCQTKDQSNASNTSETNAIDTQPNNIQEEKQNSTIDALARKFRNNFFEVVEELKLRRTLDTENEEQITTLLTEKNEIHRQWEEEVSKNSASKDMYEKREMGVVKEFEEKLQQYETNKAKYDLTEQCSTKEMNQLKDEIRALHLAKYNIEKRASELDRELQLQATARENHVKHLTEMEKSYREAVKQSNEVFDLLDQVERNVAAAGRLHRKLTYNNEHQKCQLISYKQNLEAKQQELAQIKVVVENQKALLSSADSSRRSRESNEKELRMQTELCRQLENLLNEARDNNKNLLDSLKGAQTLVDRHVDTVKLHSEMEAMAQFELDDAKTECQDMRNQLQEEKESKKLLQEDLKEKEKLWNCEKDEKENQLSEVKIQLEALTLTHNSLEDTNSKLSEQIKKLTKDVETLQDKADKDGIAFHDSKEKMEKLMEEKANEIKSLNVQLTEAQDAVLAQSKSVQEWKEQFNEIEEKMQTMTRTLDEARKDNSDLKETKEKMTKELETNENEIKSVKVQLVDAKSQVVLQTHASLQCREKSRQLEQEVEKLSAALNEMKEACKNTNNSSTQTDSQNFIQETQEDTPEEHATANEITSGDGTDVDNTAPPNKHGIHPETVHSSHEVHPSENTNVKTEVIEDCREDEITTSNGSNVSVSLSTNQHGTTATIQVENNNPLVCESKSSEPSTTAQPQVCIKQENSSNSTDQLNIEKDSTSILPPMSHNIKPALKKCPGKRHNSSETSGPTKKRVRFNIPVNDVQSDSSSDQAATEMKIIYVDNENSQGHKGVDVVDGADKTIMPTATATENQNVYNTTSYQEEISKSKDEQNRAEENTEGLQDSKIISDCQELFSDDEEEGTGMVVKSHDVGHQINKIQNLLNNQRLRTNKKRKITE